MRLDAEKLDLVSRLRDELRLQREAADRQRSHRDQVRALLDEAQRLRIPDWLLAHRLADGKVAPSKFRALLRQWRRRGRVVTKRHDNQVAASCPRANRTAPSLVEVTPMPERLVKRTIVEEFVDDELVIDELEEPDDKPEDVQEPDKEADQKRRGRRK